MAYLPLVRNRQGAYIWFSNIPNWDNLAADSIFFEKTRSAQAMKICGRCGFSAVRSESRFCGKCGAKLPDSPESSATVGSRLESAVVSAGQPSPRSLVRRRISLGSILLVTALGTYLWVQGHSPHMGFGEAMMALGSDVNAYYIKEPFYSLIVLCAAALALFGLISLVRGFAEQLKQ